jgi:uncharacterized SAM-binding protein YcdF (DUF218 family)
MSDWKRTLLGVAVRVLARPLETRAGVDAPNSADAIVVLGAPLRQDGTLSDVVEERVRAGVGLWRRGVARLLVMSGGRVPGVRATRSEAEVMGERAVGLGVAPDAIVLETESENTSRNAECVRKALRDQCITRVVVVSQPFHLRRAVLWFERMGFDARGHRIALSVQDEQPVRALRWVTREYASLARDLVVTRRPGRGPRTT